MSAPHQFAKALSALAELVTWARYDRAAGCFDCTAGGVWIRIQRVVEPAPMPSLPPPTFVASGAAHEPASPGPATRPLRLVTGRAA